jgi:molybdenum cofactor cytidylyltransferase
MGRDKLLLDVGGASMLQCAARCAIAAEVGAVVVVLGENAERARAHLEGLACRVVADPSLTKRGMNASITAAVAALPAGVAGAVVLLADMPLVTPESIRALVERHGSTGAPLVVTRYGETIAPPMLYDRTLLGELASGADGDGIGRRMLLRHRIHAEVIDAPPGALVDVDEPADLERVRASLGDGAVR